MDIVNKSLPVHAKFYEVKIEFQDMFKSWMHRDNIKTMQEAHKLVYATHGPQGVRVNGDSNRAFSVATDMVILSEDEYPKIEVDRGFFHRLHYKFESRVTSLKKHYSSGLRVPALHMAVPADYESKMVVQWDDRRKGIIVHNTTYEGELISNKPMVINRKLGEGVRDQIKTLLVQLLISEDECLAIEDRWNNSRSSKDARIERNLLKVLGGDYEISELCMLAHDLGLYGAKYDYTVHKYVLDLDNEYTPNFKISSSLRTRLIYLFGGYQLPDDYLKWFDGETTTVKESTDD